MTGSLLWKRKAVSPSYTVSALIAEGQAGCQASALPESRQRLLWRSELWLPEVLTTSVALVTTSVALVTTSVALVTTSVALVTTSVALVTTSVALVTTSVALVTTSVALVTTSVALVTTSVALVTTSVALVTTSVALVTTEVLSFLPHGPMPQPNQDPTQSPSSPRGPAGVLS